jgi:hypothetical protein
MLFVCHYLSFRCHSDLESGFHSFLGEFNIIAMIVSLSALRLRLAVTSFPVCDESFVRTHLFVSRRRGSSSL